MLIQMDQKGVVDAIPDSGRICRQMAEVLVRGG